MALNILGSCISYPINLTKLPDDKLKELEGKWGIDSSEEWIVVSQNDIDEEDIPSEAVDWDGGDFNADELDYIFDQHLGQYPYYLVYASGCTWRGTDGYNFCKTYSEIITRPYEVTLILQDEVKGGIRMIEYSHDVPMGSSTYVIGLSEEEYEELSDSDSDAVKKFVEDKF